MDSGISAYNNAEALPKFQAWVDREGDAVWVDAQEIELWEKGHPQPFERDQYLGLYADFHGVPEEPFNSYIQTLARRGIEGVGHHGWVSAMGMPLTELPRWNDIQLLTAQLARRPLADGAPVGTEVVVGPAAKRPLKLNIPLFVSDMSFGALSEEAKVALATGAARIFSKTTFHCQQWQPWQGRGGTSTEGGPSRFPSSSPVDCEPNRIL